MKKVQLEKINLVKELSQENSDLVALPECSTFIYKEKANTLQKSKLQKDSFQFMKFRLPKLMVLIS